eukprot:TRINITY_DN2198_c0_g1_i2.p1 TRINITY_DN2198_c0_g1~~TRINITY_DN2198_c0_g1_i2.p1  ORF type:complete len:448 (-),score=81.92 TRINITY_DN2198_c0_g1_i2:100-1443(-)
MVISSYRPDNFFGGNESGYRQRATLNDLEGLSSVFHREQRDGSLVIKSQPSTSSPNVDDNDDEIPDEKADSGGQETILTSSGQFVLQTIEHNLLLLRAVPIYRRDIVTNLLHLADYYAWAIFVAFVSQGRRAELIHEIDYKERDIDIGYVRQTHAQYLLQLEFRALRSVIVKVFEAFKLIETKSFRNFVSKDPKEIKLWANAELGPKLTAIDCLVTLHDNFKLLFVQFLDLVDPDAFAQIQRKFSLYGMLRNFIFEHHYERLIADEHITEQMIKPEWTLKDRSQAIYLKFADSILNYINEKRRRIKQSCSGMDTNQNIIFRIFLRQLSLALVERLAKLNFNHAGRQLMLEEIQAIHRGVRELNVGDSAMDYSLLENYTKAWFFDLDDLLNFIATNKNLSFGSQIRLLETAESQQKLPINTRREYLARIAHEYMHYIKIGIELIKRGS